MNVKTVSLSSLALFTCFFADQTLAATSATKYTTAAAVSAQEFRLLPVIDVWGYTGKHTLGDAQVLIPLIGDQNKVFYVAAEGKVASKNNGWMAGGGVGYRQVIEQRIYGVYVTADQNNALDNRRFLVINPGIETLGTSWDFRANGYFPTKRTWSEKSSFIDFEDHCGIYDDVRFEGHKQFDRQTLVTTQGEVVAGLGADAEIGRTIPIIDNLKGFVGGYYFNNKDTGHVDGGSARVTWQATNNLGVEVIDTYDNQRHNTAMVGIKLSLGGFGKDDTKKFGIAARLMDPIEHNIATAANGYTVPVLENTKITYHRFGAEILEHDNIWFFKQGNNAQDDVSIINGGDGTFENPFVGFNQQNVAVVSNNFGSIGATKDKFPLLYFAPGIYSLTGQGFTTDGRFSLPLGWGMYGRADYTYKAPAFVDDRALFEGGLDIVGAVATASNNDLLQATTLNSIRVLNDKAMDAFNFNLANAATYIENAGLVLIKNTEIKSVVTSDVPGDDAVGMFVGNASTVNFEQLSPCEIGKNTVEGISAGSDGYGIFSLAGIIPTVNGNGSSSNSVQTNVTDTVNINFNSGENVISGRSDAESGFGFGFGIKSNSIAGNGVNALTNLKFNGGNNRVIAEVGNFGGEADGIHTRTEASNATNAAANVSFNGGNNNVTADAFTTLGNFGATFGIYAETSVSGAANATTNIRFNSGNNNVTSSAIAPSPDMVNSATGIYAQVVNANAASATTNVIFNGGNNAVIATVAADNIIFVSSARGIFADTSATVGSNVFANIIFNGGNNAITATAITAVDCLGNAVGIGTNIFARTGALGETNITFNDGNNSIAANGGSLSYGLFATSSITGSGTTGIANMIFNGGDNNIMSMACISGVAYGIYISPTVIFFPSNGISKIVFNGGANEFTVTAGSAGKAYGIYSYTSTGGITAINFNNQLSKVNFIVNAGVNRYGIFTEGAGAASINRVQGDILNYAKFITDDIVNPDSKGSAIVLNGVNWNGLWNV